MRPIVSYNYGANYTKRMNDSIKYSVYCRYCDDSWHPLFMVFPMSDHDAFQRFRGSYGTGGSGAEDQRGIGFIVSTIGAVLAGAFEALGRGVSSLSHNVDEAAGHHPAAVRNPFQIYRPAWGMVDVPGGRVRGGHPCGYPLEAEKDKI